MMDRLGGVTVRIGELAKLIGCSRDTLRYYGRSGLLPAPQRTPNGYRNYPPEAVERLHFIRRAQDLHLTLREIAAVVAIADTGACPCPHIRAAVLNHIDQISARIEALVDFRSQLQAYTERALESENCNCCLPSDADTCIFPSA